HARWSANTRTCCPPQMLDNIRRDFVSLQKEIELPPGKYVLETAAQDRIGERLSTNKTEFTVVAPAAGLGLSSVSVARAVTPSGGEDRDSGFHLADKSVQPALDG